MSGLDRQVGRFRILHELGRGGMATVYLAEQTDLGRRVALKELSAFHARDESLAARFLREAQLSGSLSHPNIVTVHEYLVSEGVPYIAMEYCQRGSLRNCVGRITVAQAAGVIEGVLAGLALAESRGIVHRDLKPENLMVTTDGTVKIADFGIAKALDNAGSANLTMTGSTVGTPHYMAPEQAMAADVGPATDLYSVGIIAFEMLTGRVPYADTNTPMAVLLRQVNEPVEPAASVNPDLDPGIAAWVDAMVAKRPEDRPQTAAAAWEQLEDTVLAVLGPRWRRQARLLEHPDELTTAKPLTPAPFASLGPETMDAPRMAVMPAPAAMDAESPSVTIPPLARPVAPRPAEPPPAPPVPPPARTPQPPVTTGEVPRRVVPSSQPTIDTPRPGSAAEAAGTQSRSLSGRLLGAALVLLVGGLIAAVVAILALRDSGSAAPHVVPPPAGPSVRLTAGAAVNVGSHRVVLAGGAGGVWLMSRGPGLEPGAVSPVDGSGRPGQPITLGGIPAGMVSTGSGVWVLETSGYTDQKVFLERVDPSAGVVQSVARLPGTDLVCLTSGAVTCNPVEIGNRIWVPVDSELYGVPESGRGSPRAIDAGGQIWDVLAANGALWVISGKSLLRIDPASGAITQVMAPSLFPLGLQPNHLAATVSRIWVSAMAGNGVTPNPGRLLSYDSSDPGRGVLVVHMAKAGMIAGDGTTLWVERFTGHDELTALDGSTGRSLGPSTRLTDDVAWIVPVKGGLIVSTFRAAAGRRAIIPMTVQR